MTTFTPLSAAIGGALIGLAAVLLMLLTGRLAGISGILGGLLSSSRDRAWRVAFILGLILAPVAGTLAGYPMSAPAMPASWVIVIAAALLVGFGTRLASRSIVATVVFMSSAIVVVALTRQLGG